MSTDTTAAVIVLAVHFVLDCTRRRFIALPPVTVNVFETVILPAMVKVSVFVAVQVLVRL